MKISELENWNVMVTISLIQPLALQKPKIWEARRSYKPLSKRTLYQNKKEGRLNQNVLPEDELVMQYRNEYKRDSWINLLVPTHNYKEKEEERVLLYEIASTNIYA
jgi:hypothetical protein